MTDRDKPAGGLIPLSVAAEQLHVSVRTLYRMIKDGQLEAVKVRGSTRVRRSEIERIINA